jgi:hypothetical protein
LESVALVGENVTSPKASSSTDIHQDIRHRPQPGRFLCSNDPAGTFVD